MAIIDIIREIAQYGQPPVKGVSLISVGYEDLFRLLETSILDDLVIKEGRGVEKYIVGNYGTGKTHFLRQVQEIAMDKGLITAEVHLNRDINHLYTLGIYREIAETISHREQETKGIRNLIKLCMKNIQKEAENALLDGNIEDLLLQRINHIKHRVQLGDSRFKSVLVSAMEAYALNQKERFESACSWLEGNFTDRYLRRALNVPEVERRELNTFCERAILALCKFIRYCNFNGTVICYDEAELTMNLRQRDFQRILQALRQLLDRLVTEEDVGLLRLYAFTPDVIERMMQYPALQQRISDPDPERGFTEGNPLAPQINLERPFNTIERTIENFRAIGNKIVNAFCDEYMDRLNGCDNVRELLDIIIRQFEQENPTITRRREFMRELCTGLNDIYNSHVSNNPVDIISDNTEDEV